MSDLERSENGANSEITDPCCPDRRREAPNRRLAEPASKRPTARCVQRRDNGQSPPSGRSAGVGPRRPAQEAPPPRIAWRPRAQEAAATGPAEARADAGLRRSAPGREDWTGEAADRGLTDDDVAEQAQDDAGLTDGAPRLRRSGPKPGAAQAARRRQPSGTPPPARRRPRPARPEAPAPRSAGAGAGRPGAPRDRRRRRHRAGGGDAPIAARTGAASESATSTRARS